MSHSAQSFPIALDIGGTWIKCARTSADGNFEPLERFANPCREAALDGIGFTGKIAQAILDRKEWGQASRIHIEHRFQLSSIAFTSSLWMDDNSAEPL